VLESIELPEAAPETLGGVYEILFGIKSKRRPAAEIWAMALFKSFYETLRASPDYRESGLGPMLAEVPIHKLGKGGVLSRESFEISLVELPTRRGSPAADRAAVLVTAMDASILWATASFCSAALSDPADVGSADVVALDLAYREVDYSAIQAFLERVGPRFVMHNQVGRRDRVAADFWAKLPEHLPATMVVEEKAFQILAAK